MLLRTGVCCRKKTDKKWDGTCCSNADTVVGIAPGKKAELACGGALDIKTGGRELANDGFNFVMLRTSACRCTLNGVSVARALGWVNAIGLTPLSYDAA